MSLTLRLGSEPVASLSLPPHTLFTLDSTPFPIPTPSTSSDSSSEMGVDINYLPDEIMLSIFELLSYKDLLRIAAVSKRWLNLSNDHELWAIQCRKKNWDYDKNKKIKTPKKIFRRRIACKNFCHECGRSTARRFPLMGITLCKNCENDDPKYETLLKTKAKEQYLLNDQDLAQLQCHERHNRWGHTKYAFLKSSLEEACFKKFGGEEGFNEMTKKRDKGREKRRKAQNVKKTERENQMQDALRKRGLELTWTCPLYRMFVNGQRKTKKNPKIYTIDEVTDHIAQVLEVRVGGVFDVILQENRLLLDLITARNWTAHVRGRIAATDLEEHQLHQLILYLSRLTLFKPKAAQSSFRHAPLGDIHNNGNDNGNAPDGSDDETSPKKKKRPSPTKDLMLMHKKFCSNSSISTRKQELENQRPFRSLFCESSEDEDEDEEEDDEEDDEENQQDNDNEDGGDEEEEAENSVDEETFDEEKTDAPETEPTLVEEECNGMDLESNPKKKGKGKGVVEDEDDGDGDYTHEDSDDEDDVFEAPSCVVHKQNEGRSTPSRKGKEKPSQKGKGKLTPRKYKKQNAGLEIDGLPSDFVETLLSHAIIPHSAFPPP